VVGRDPSSSPQPYEHLAGLFRRAGEPGKANDILYAAREQRRRLALSKVNDRGQPKKREIPEGIGLWLLRLTIGYGLGHRYFRVVWWVIGLAIVGMLLLIAAGQPPERWPSLLLASFDQLLPAIKPNKAYEAIIFGDSTAKPPNPTGY